MSNDSDYEARKQRAFLRLGIHVHRRKFEPVPTLDLYTIEVKPPGAQALPGLHQTLAHGRFADFVIFIAAKAPGQGHEVEAQAARFGVGLVLYEDPKNWRSFEMLVEPKRTVPDADLRDQFISDALREDRSTDEVLGWLRQGART